MAILTKSIDQNGYSSDQVKNLSQLKKAIKLNFDKIAIKNENS